MSRLRHSLAIVAIAGCSTPHGTLDPEPTVVNEPATLAPVPGFQPPVAMPASISSTFGPRWKWSESRYEFHLGIDYFADLGTPLLAIGDGMVTGVYPEGSAVYPEAGNAIVVLHSMPAQSFHHQQVEKFYAMYFHCDTIAVKAGDTVKAGQMLGTMGMTGTTEFVHLHFETRVQTACSLPYQLAHPESSCSVGFDPHVHPYLFVGGANVDQIQVDQIPSDDFVLHYAATRGDLDLDVIETDLGTVDFETRQGMDATSEAHLDDFGYGFLRLIPAEFRSATQLLEFEMHFSRPPSFVELRDIYGHGLRYRVVTE